MRKERKEVISKSYETIYIANDGTEFNNEEECRNYDASAKGVIFAKYNKLIVGKATEYSILDCGCEDNDLDIVKPTCERDKDTIMQMYFFTNPSYAGEQEDKNYQQRINGWVAQAEEYIDRAIKEDDVVFICWSFDHDCCWFMGTRNSIKERIDKFVQDFTKDDVEQK